MDMRFSHHFIALWIGLLVLSGAWAQDKPTPNYKPYPEKASKVPVEKVPEEAAPSFSKPMKKEPQMALKARPPTSGKEPMLNVNEQNVPLKEVMHQTSKLNFYDMDRKMIAQHCVTSKGKWHPDTTCYTVD